MRSEDTTTTTTTTALRERFSGNLLPRSRLKASTSTKPQEKKFLKRFSNSKMTILCGFLTILVFRGGIGIGDLDGYSKSRQFSEDIDRILREIRYDSDDRSDSGGLHTLDNSTYSLGPKISEWDDQRKTWMAQNKGSESILGGIYGKGKDRMMLVTGSRPNPCDNPIGDHYLLKWTKNKIDYCRIHGIEIMFNIAQLDLELGFVWSKLTLIRKLMLSHPEVEWIWWMDDDASFTNMSFEIPLHKYDDYNMVVQGYPDLLFQKKSWIALNTGSFLMRNCQWSLDLLDVWARMGQKGWVTKEQGRILTDYLSDRPSFESDDRSSLIYLLLTQGGRWMGRVFLENSYYLNGFWVGLVDDYREMIGNYLPQTGDDKWSFVTHFLGCNPCGKYSDYPMDKCLKAMDRAFNFADNQVLQISGFMHKHLSTSEVRKIRKSGQ